MIDYQWVAPLTPQRGEFRNTLIINGLRISRIKFIHKLQLKLEELANSFESGFDGHHHQLGDFPKEGT